MENLRFTSSIEEAFLVHLQIPEFNLYQNIEEFYEHTKNKNQVAVTALLDEVSVGYLVAYEKYNKDDLYLWLAGVIPQYRRREIYSAIYKQILKYAYCNSYKSLSIKTMNKFQIMLKFIINHDFYIEKTLEKDNIMNTEIYGKKYLIEKSAYCKKNNTFHV